MSHCNKSHLVTLRVYIPNIFFLTDYVRPKQKDSKTRSLLQKVATGSERDRESNTRSEGTSNRKTPADMYGYDCMYAHRYVCVGGRWALLEMRIHSSSQHLYPFYPYVFIPI